MAVAARSNHRERDAVRGPRSISRLSIRLQLFTSRLGASSVAATFGRCGKGALFRGHPFGWESR